MFRSLKPRDCGFESHLNLFLEPTSTEQYWAIRIKSLTQWNNSLWLGYKRSFSGIHKSDALKTWPTHFLFFWLLKGDLSAKHVGLAKHVAFECKTFNSKQFVQDKLRFQPWHDHLHIITLVNIITRHVSKFNLCLILVIDQFYKLYRCLDYIKIIYQDQFTKGHVIVFNKGGVVWSG